MSSKEYMDAYHAAHREEHKAYMRAWHAAHRESEAARQQAYRKEPRGKALHAARAREYHLRRKMDAFNAYGGPVCACCGETLFEGLTIDHIAGDGAAHRHAINSRLGNDLYRWLKLHGYPPGFQVLCATCNLAKGTGDHCPHKDRQLEADL